MNLPATHKQTPTGIEDLAATLHRIYPDVSFIPGVKHTWSPENQQISYRLDDSQHSLWSLLHETGHALLDHRSYAFDLELLRMELDAWQTAQQIGSSLGIIIDPEHIEDCLDTYRDWLHKRSTCPRCGCVSLQVSKKYYACHNCAADWFVSSSRFCRTYRLNSAYIKTRLLS